MSALVSIQDLRVSFRLGKHEVAPAVRGVSFDIPANSTVAVVGESGSGKSVTAMSILRLLPDNAMVDPASRIVYAGDDLLRAPESRLRAIRGHDITAVFQEPMSSLNPVYTVGDQIAEVLRLHRGLAGRAARERTLELLDEVGIPNPRARLNAYPHEMSGGQQQRVMIAMAIANEPKLLIADEPTTALDVTIQRQVLELLARLKDKHRMSVLFITHDLGVVGEIADRVVVMRQGEVQEQGEVARIFEAPSHPYTQALLACRPTVDARPRRLPVIDDFLSGRGGAETAPLVRPPKDGAVVQVRGLCKEFKLKTGLFRSESLHAVKGVDFDLARGRTLGLVGESGSGKTTVGMMLMRLLDASGGQVLWDGTDLLQLSDEQMMAYRRRIQVIFQNPYASLNPRFTIGQILTEPMKIHRLGANEADRVERSHALLARVGLPEGAFYKYPHEFSGGQRQRIAIARALAVEPEVLICDESVSALDVSVQATVLNLLLDLQEERGLAYLFISHDLAVVKYMADDMIVMREGEVVEAGDAQAIYAEPQHDYTRRLLGAIPRGLAGRIGPLASAA